MSVVFLLNGMQMRVEPRADESLLETLRERCGIRSLKDGCAPQGQCGCCLALIDGHAKVTCAMSTRSAQGRQILTLEGLSEADRDLVSRAFVAAAGVQCGFCIPGIALRAKHLLDQNPHPTRADIARAIDQHLCRCTGYKKIVDAIELMARGRRGETIPTALQVGGVGERLARYDAVRAALGDRPFVDDLTRRGLLHGALVLSAHSRAVIRRIDTSRAKALPGVIAVVTAADVPGERWYGLIEQDWPGLVAEGEEARCVGDVLAAVAAIDRHTARDAAALVSVDYETLPPVLDPDAALREGAPRVNPRHPNLLSRSIVTRGDADAALTRSAHVVHGTWQTQRVEHLFLEPESALVEMTSDGGIRLYSQGQGIFDDRRQVAAFLGLAEDRVFVELVPSGGAFGGKEDMSVQAQTALLCLMSRHKKTSPQPTVSASARELVRTAKAIGHPARLRILAMLQGRTLCVCQMTASWNSPRPPCLGISTSCGTAGLWSKTNGASRCSTVSIRPAPSPRSLPTPWPAWAPTRISRATARSSSACGPSPSRS